LTPDETSSGKASKDMNRMTMYFFIIFSLRHFIELISLIFINHCIISIENLQISELLHGISDAQVFDLYYSPRELEVRVGEWVGYYNNHRCHEAKDNVTPSDNYFGRLQEILEHRKKKKNRKSIQINSIIILYTSNLDG